MKIVKIIAVLLLSISIPVLTGCATPGANVLPQGGAMTMATIYHQKTSDSGDSDVGEARAQLRPLSTATKQIIINNSVYERSSSINRQFKQAPNPQIGLYVFPHIVEDDGDQEPVPGYTTAFFLYKKNNFALPSEHY
jgi:conjugative transfer region lipoprotein (TIGR03751 family)